MWQRIGIPSFSASLAINVLLQGLLAVGTPLDQVAEVPTVQASRRIGIPMLQPDNFKGVNGRGRADGTQTFIHIQNVGALPAEAIILLWEQPIGRPEAQPPPPILVLVSGLIPPGSVWTWSLAELNQHLHLELETPAPSSARLTSAIVYAVDQAQADALARALRDAGPAWVTFDRAFQAGLPVELGGETFDTSAPAGPMAVVVRRPSYVQVKEVGTDGIALDVANAVTEYEGIGVEMTGAPMRPNGQYVYYVPAVPLSDLPVHALDRVRFGTVLNIQDLGHSNAEVRISYLCPDGSRSQDERVIHIAPGLTEPVVPMLPCIRVEPGPLVLDDVIAPGNIRITSTQPLGIVVDVGGSGRARAGGYLAIPADSYDSSGMNVIRTSGGAQAFIPLLRQRDGDFRTYEAQIYIQNLDETQAAQVELRVFDDRGNLVEEPLAPVSVPAQGVVARSIRFPRDSTENASAQVTVLTDPSRPQLTPNISLIAIVMSEDGPMYAVNSFNAVALGPTQAFPRAMNRLTTSLTSVSTTNFGEVTATVTYSFHDATGTIPSLADGMLFPIDPRALRSFSLSGPLPDGLGLPRGFMGAALAHGSPGSLLGGQAFDEASVFGFALPDGVGGYLGIPFGLRSAHP